MLPHPAVQLALWQFNNNEPEAGAQTLEKLVATESVRADAHYVLAEIARDQRRYEDAWTHLLSAENATPRGRWSKKYNQHLTNLLLESKARTATGRRDWQAAQSLFTQLSKTSRATSECELSLGRAAFYLNQPDAARAHFERAAERYPTEHVLPTQQMAMLYTEIDDVATAESWFKRGIESPNPQTASQLRQHFIRWYLQQNRGKNARQTAANANPSNNEDQRRYDYLSAISSRMLGDFARAEKLLTRLHTDEPQHFHISNQLALVLIEQSDEKKQATAFLLSQRNLQALPNAKEALSTHGWILHQRGQSNEAEQHLLRCISDGQADRDTAYYLSKVKRSLGKQPEAEAFLRAAKTSKGTFFNLFRCK